MIFYLVDFIPLTVASAPLNGFLLSAPKQKFPVSFTDREFFIGTAFAVNQFLTTSASLLSLRMLRSDHQLQYR